MSGLTSGERAVWAAEFVRVRAAGDGAGCSALLAAGAVEAMRTAAREPDSVIGELHGPARAMLLDMLGTGADR